MKNALRTFLCLALVVMPLLSHANDEDEAVDICGSVDFSKYLDRAITVEGPTILLRDLSDGFDRNEFKALHFHGLTVYQAPLQKVKWCYQGDAFFAFKFSESQVTRDEYEAIKAFDELAPDEVRLVRVALKPERYTGAEDTRGRVSENLQFENAWRWNRLLKAREHYDPNAGDLMALLQKESPVFRISIYYDGDLPDDIARALLSLIAFRTGLDPTSVLLQREAKCRRPFEGRFQAFLHEEGSYRPPNFEFISGAIRAPVCGPGASLSTLLRDMPPELSFDDVISNDQGPNRSFRIVTLVASAIKDLGYAATVSPIGPIERSIATLQVTGLRNIINPKEPLLGDRVERLKLSIKREESKLTIDQQYEYNLRDGKHRWRDPESKSNPEPALAANAERFLGALIAQVKLKLMTK